MEDKTLIVDTELSPDIAYVYGNKWEVKVVGYKKYSYIMGFSAKWLNGPQVTKTAIETTEKRLLKELWHLLDEADVVVGWNSDKFDHRKLNMRFAKFGIPPPSPFKSIDLIKTVRTKFLLPSNALDDFLNYYELDRKLDNEKNLFIKCAEGDPKALKQLAKYNKHDTLITEKALKFLSPWIKAGVSIYSEKTICPKAGCGSRELQRRGLYSNATTTYQRLRCNKCLGWSRTTLNLRETKPLISI